MFTEENIEWQYIEHPDFKEAVYNKYSDGLSPENWKERVLDLIKDYGYTIEIVHPFKSEKYSCIWEVELYKNGEWLFGLQNNKISAIEQAILEGLKEEIIFN